MLAAPEVPEQQLMTPTMTNDNEAPAAFVIMPFDAELDEVYREFILPVLEGVGYSVSRADDLYGQNNILRDIVQRIKTSALVIADLTGLNANVFYELGIAHGLGTPVVLLTQNIDELPFDLRSYRVVIYDTHFARIQRARESFQQTALEAFRGTLEFGSPVSDFSGERPQNRPRSPSLKPQSASDEDGDDDGDGEAGWLDHAAGLAEGFERLVNALGSSTAATLSIGTKSSEYAKRIDTARATQGKQVLSSVRFIANAYSRELVQYGQELSSTNDNYEAIARATQDSIEFMISHGRIKSAQDRDALLSFVTTLDQVEQAARGALPNISAMRTSLKSMEGLERGLTRTAKVVGAELDRFMGNVETTIASVRRGAEVGRRKLASEDDSH